MERKSVFFLFILPFLITASCSENDLESSKRKLYPLAAGNYWIYRTKIIFPDDYVQLFEHTDSVWIEKDTTIDGKNYWVQNGTLSGTYYLRDSADCILLRQLDYEQIIYSENVSDTLQKTPPIYKVMTDVNELKKVEAGTFRASVCRTLLRQNVAEHAHNHFPPYNDKFLTAEQFICSPNVGLIMRVEYYIGNRIEYELLRYNTYKQFSHQ